MYQLESNILNLTQVRVREGKQATGLTNRIDKYFSNMLKSIEKA